MNNIFDAATVSIIIRLSVALVLGMIIGIERVWAHKTAGMRTYALVAMGSALFVLISNEMVQYYFSINGTNGMNGLSPLMIVAQIVVGIGFIGSGLIFSRESKMMGLTTATGLWVSAGIGMASGFGLFNIAIVATTLTLFVFVVLWYVEEKIKKSKYFKDNDTPDNN